jgi:hypothetical protein
MDYWRMTGMRPTSRFFGSATEFSAFRRKTTGKSSYQQLYQEKSCCAVVTADYVTMNADLRLKYNNICNLRQKFEKCGLVSNLL